MKRAVPTAQSKPTRSPIHRNGIRLGSALLLLGGCVDWPRYAHLPEETGVVWPAGATPLTTVEWTQSGGLTDSLTAPTALDPSEGLWFTGTLVGGGHDPDQGPEETPDNSCGLTSQFPPAGRGAYTGQSLWGVVELRASGTVCVGAEVEGSALSTDLLLYDLSECSIPQGPLSHPDTGETLGLGEESTAIAWSHDIPTGAIFGVVLAASAPDDPNLEIPYSVWIALVSPAADGGSGSCPDHPEEP